MERYQLTLNNLKSNPTFGITFSYNNAISL